MTEKQPARLPAQLIVFGGLPGTGKTSIARALAARLGAVYLRIDAIEHALGVAGMGEVGAAGYVVAQALAASNLGNGARVVADCVNPVPESRAGWRAVARQAGVRIGEVELICSDAAEHRRRVEGRVADLEGFRLPSWADVLARHTAPWPEPHVVIDTATIGVAEAVALCEQLLA